MCSLNPIILQALSSTCPWSAATAHRVLSAMASAMPGAVMDWEQGDEQWGRIIRGGEVLAYVHAAWPLAIILPALEDCVRRLYCDAPIEVLVASSFSDKVFSVERAVLERMCSRVVSENVDYGRLSINDLWWATT